MVTLQFCWAHMRRDFIQCAAAQVDLTGWCQAWLARIAAIYRLNEARLARYDPTLERQSAVFDAAQDALQAALDGLFARAGRELDGLQEHAREGKALRSLVNHREGLSVFVARPRTPMDNNFAERVLRGPVIGRRLSFGSDSETGARFTALMYSVIGTLNLNGIDVRRWLEAWLAACAENGGRAPHDTAPLAALVDGRCTPARTGGADMTGSVECRYHGRDFSADEMALLRALIAGPPALNRHALSKEFCRRIGWFKADGGLKDMMARVVMLAMHKDGASNCRRRNGRAHRAAPRPSDRTPNRRCCRRLTRCRRSARSACGRSSATAARASSGTSSSPATTTSVTPPWSAPRCAMPCTPTTARRWPCSASPPPPGPSPRATASSAGRDRCARRTCRSSSTTRAS